MSNSVWPYRRQPTRLPRPWNSPGKNTGVGCHFLLQCMKVKCESEVTQSCPTLCDPIDSSPPGSSVHGLFQARVLEWGTLYDRKKKNKDIGNLKAKCYTETIGEINSKMSWNFATHRLWAFCFVIHVVSFKFYLDRTHFAHLENHHASALLIWQDCCDAQRSYKS